MDEIGFWFAFWAFLGTVVFSYGLPHLLPFLFF
ncbi:hypothetical protein HNQ69_000622 [Bartonella callosciuri]|uniref:Uncharacterized protein n=1 Tax=Bartonella callosciuri TaxID=686223 RepID=A0A840NQZ4_9HYPH|nr:hypothetical protein [Bartonella callosciuri]